MKVNCLKGVVFALSATLLAGCAFNKANDGASARPELPSWVSMPNQEVGEGALAATECVADNAGMSILKSKATALARAGIAQQIDINVQAMDKTYQSLTESGEESESGSTFESVSKQVTEQSLQGAIPERVGYITGRDGSEQLCVMVVLSPEKNRKVFESIMQASDRQVGPGSEDILYQEFRAGRAQDELRDSLSAG